MLLLSCLPRTHNKPLTERAAAPYSHLHFGHPLATTGSPSRLTNNFLHHLCSPASRPSALKAARRGYARTSRRRQLITNDALCSVLQRVLTSGMRCVLVADQARPPAASWLSYLASQTAREERGIAWQDKRARLVAGWAMTCWRDQSSSCPACTTECRSERRDEGAEGRRTSSGLAPSATGSSDELSESRGLREGDD